MEQRYGDEPTDQDERYGDGRTVHDSTWVHVELDSAGRVIAVWFRCRQLRFKASKLGRESNELATFERLRPVIAVVFEGEEKKVI